MASIRILGIAGSGYYLLLFSYYLSFVFLQSEFLIPIIHTQSTHCYYMFHLKSILIDK